METITPDFFSPDSSGTDFSGSAPKEAPKKHNRKLLLLPAAVLAALFAAQGASAYRLLNPKEPEQLSAAQTAALEKTLDIHFPERKKNAVPLPFPTVPADLFINAESAVIIDALTGNILFEKNADEEIPPASMTKLVEMYVVFEAVENGEVSLDDIVPLPPESWARNLPSDASLMFLGEGQRVTLRELLLGLAVASGNDASIAVANYVCKTMEAFVERMNSTVKKLGLEKTHFVESSGYSELNVTTAKEFAAFCKAYIERFPFALKDFHAQKVIRYPLEKNLPKSIAERTGDRQAVVQYNTNKLLSVLEGCDGLKTGFIYESGFNIALTAERNGARYISVTMKGPGTGSAQGNKYRIQDGTTLMEYAFSKFYPYSASGTDARSFTVGTAGSKEKSVLLVPAKKELFSVPFIYGNSPKEAAESIQVTASIPHIIFGPFEEGQQFGMLTYTLNGRALCTIPLVSDRKSGQTDPLSWLWEFAAYRLSLLFA